MTISAQVAIYPLRQQRLTPAIEALMDAFKVHGLAAEVGSMSTTVLGDADSVFTALRDGFARAAETGHVVMTVTVSNACPVER
jgi:uncharacterized protein YqgV (UPF0045/DUF77 family)